MIRILKSVLVLIVALQALFYAINNIVNLDAAHGAIAYVMSMADNAAYPKAFGPPVTSPAPTWFATWLVIIGELTVALVAFKGVLDLLAASGKSADVFNRSKSWAVLGCGFAIVVWMGFFMTAGGAWFQMWQTQIGDSSLRGAFMFAASSGIVMLFVNQPDV